MASAESPDTQYIVRYRKQMTELVDAHQLSWQETVRRLAEIKEMLEARNYGLADDALDELLSDLPHDFGAQEFTPMLDRHLARLRDR